MQRRYCDTHSLLIWLNVVVNILVECLFAHLENVEK